LIIEINQNLGHLLNALTSFITGRKTSWVTLLIGLIFAVLAFGPLSAPESDAAPTDGLPANNETVLVNKALEDLPGSDGTVAVVVYSSESKLTELQKLWITGTFDPFTQSFVDGAGDKFLEITSSEVNGSAFVPPAQISEDETVAVITVPLSELEEVGERAERIAEMRSLAKEGMPTGLSVYVTGPEGFQVDIAGVFAGADFTLLLSTVVIVAFLLLVTYRSPVLWLVPLIVIGTADGMATQLAPQLSTIFLGITADGSITGILSVLVFGAGTNYALLLIARYREELLVNEDRHQAMATALKGVTPAVLASGGTVALALLTLLFAELGGNRSLGLVVAGGIVMAMFAALVVLPAAIVVFGRGLFWPFVPKFGGVNKSDTGLWAKLGRGVSKRPVIVAIAGFVILAILTLGSAGVKVGLSSTEQFRVKPEAVSGQEVLAKAFPAGSTTPAIVIVNNDYADRVATEARNVDGVAEVIIGDSTSSITKIDVVLDAESQSEEAYVIIKELRASLGSIDGADALVGGLDAQRLDVKETYESDQWTVIPLILILVFLVLVLLLKSLVAPMLLLLTVVASFFSAIGASWLIFDNIFGIAALDLSVFLYSFLFLVALGVDYNIFLVTRAKEEAEKLGLKEGMIKALASTGGVITSAGILLAAVFAVLGVLPLIALYQIGIIVGIGVLLDTLLVRTVIVPSLAFITGKYFWWPRHKTAKP
jgi:RND superfamily putative drug exporter